MASFASPITNREAILTRIARSDRSAVQECVELYGKMIWALAKQYTDSAADAERAVPEIFKDIWQKAAFCDLEISDEAVWIALIARRHLTGCKLKDNCGSSPEMPVKVYANGYGEVQKKMYAA